MEVGKKLGEFFVHFSGHKKAYHGVAVGLFNDSGQYLEASKSYRKYAEGVEKMLMDLVESDILNIEQINIASAKGVKYKQISLILAVCILLVLSIACIVWRMMKHRLNKKQDEIIRYSELLKEVENETEILRELYENKTLDKELRNVLMQRMDILNQFILSRVSPNYSDKPAEEELRSLIDSKDNFLESTCKTFKALHPEFTVFLASFDLTERERGCCCLYCMGMRGNEIASYMGLTDQSYYNLSGAIRKKLGLMIIGGRQILASKKSVSTLEGIDKKAFTDFLKSEKISWKNPDDLLKVIEFITD